MKMTVRKMLSEEQLKKLLEVEPKVFNFNRRWDNFRRTSPKKKVKIETNTSEETKKTDLSDTKKTDSSDTKQKRRYMPRD